LELLREHNEEYAKQIGVTRAKGSIKAYEAIAKQVERFLHIHYNMEDIPLR
jgi:hypothetical protein